MRAASLQRGRRSLARKAAIRARRAERAGVGQVAVDGGGHLGIVGWIDVDGKIAAGFGDRAAVRGDAGHAERQALLDRQAPAFGQAGIHREHRAAVERGQIGIAHMAQPADGPAGEFGCGELRHQRLAAPAFYADEHAGCRQWPVLLAQALDGAHDGDVVLARLERADLQEVAPRLQAVASERAACRRVGGGRLRPAHDDAVDRPGVGRAEVTRQFAAHEFRVHHPAVDQRHQVGELAHEFLLEGRGLPC